MISAASTSLLTLAIANVSAVVALRPFGPSIPAAPDQAPSGASTAATTSGSNPATIATRAGRSASAVPLGSGCFGSEPRSAMRDGPTEDDGEGVIVGDEAAGVAVALAAIGGRDWAIDSTVAAVVGARLGSPDPAGAPQPDA